MSQIPYKSGAQPIGADRSREAWESRWGEAINAPLKIGKIGIESGWTEARRAVEFDATPVEWAECFWELLILLLFPKELISLTQQSLSGTLTRSGFIVPGIDS